MQHLLNVLEAFHLIIKGKPFKSVYMFLMLLKEASHALQGCIYLSEKCNKTVVL